MSEELECSSAGAGGGGATGEGMVTGEGRASEALLPPRKGVMWTASSQSKSNVSLLPSEEFNLSLGAGADPPAAARVLERARGFYSGNQKQQLLSIYQHQGIKT